MAMSRKEKLRLVWLLVAVAFSFVFRHFWASAVYALGRAVALNLVSLPGLLKFAGEISSVHLLP
ncbi:MAG: hypothetical protein DMG49_11205 [Acidobacteria bacterium]|nr:MAG: hypothetical protein DMG49_11205 [Acidobacteriota bacterium]